MLKVFEHCDDIDFRQLMDVYEQWNSAYGKDKYSKQSENLQILYAQQDFYDFLVSFFAVDNAKYFIWAPLGRYAAALRVEPYKEGLLVEALETRPDARRKGYATDLMNATMSYLRSGCHLKVFSHVKKDNEASLLVHYRCGFHILSESAVYIDGSRHNDAYTLVYNL